MSEQHDNKNRETTDVSHNVVYRDRGILPSLAEIAFGVDPEQRSTRPDGAAHPEEHHSPEDGSSWDSTSSDLD